MLKLNFTTITFGFKSRPGECKAFNILFTPEKPRLVNSSPSDIAHSAQIGRYAFDFHENNQTTRLASLGKFCPSRQFSLSSNFESTIKFVFFSWLKKEEIKGGHINIVVFKIPASNRFTECKGVLTVEFGFRIKPLLRQCVTLYQCSRLLRIEIKRARF